MKSLDLSLKTTHIGSLPYEDLEKALEVAFTFDIPAWPQLSKFKEEGMLWQFVKNFPGFDLKKERIITQRKTFEEEMLKFYESYLEVIENKNVSPLKGFLHYDFSKAFFPFLEKAKSASLPILKGQITGPFTLGISLKTEDEVALIFRDDLRDLTVKFITLSALAQVYHLKEVSEGVILFIDEPGLSGFGSSAYISLSKDLVLEMIKEIATAISQFSAKVGVHVCANTSWDILLESGIDILNFDSFSYFDKFVIYAEKIKEFLGKGGYLAFGAVPTSRELLEKVNEKEVISRFEAQIKTLGEALSLKGDKLLKHILITPACGLGSLPEEFVPKVLALIRSLKEALG
ncbi:MAG: hypothetical protein ACK4Y7_00635 [Caldimicrobium sp.]